MIYGMAGADLGTRIRRGRERKRMTQQQFADALKVSVRTVGAWERNEADPRNSLGAIIDLLGEDVTREAEPDPNEAKLHSIDGLDAVQLAKLVEAYRVIRNGHRKAPSRERAG